MVYSGIQICALPTPIHSLEYTDAISGSLESHIPYIAGIVKGAFWKQKKKTEIVSERPIFEQGQEWVCGIVEAGGG